MYADRYIDNKREYEQELALEKLEREEKQALEDMQEWYEELTAERDMEEDITAQYEEHMLERIGAI